MGFLRDHLALCLHGPFLYAVISLQGDFTRLRTWYGAALAHSAFVGMMTNLLMGVRSARSWEAHQMLSWGEPVTLWLINLGLLVFIGLKISADIRIGAAVMGIGVLLGVFTMVWRLRLAQGEGRCKKLRPWSSMIISYPSVDRSVYD